MAIINIFKTLTLKGASLLTLALLFLKCGTDATRWRFPCRGSIASFPEFLPDLIHVRGEADIFVAHRIWMKAHEIIEIATYLRDRYVTERIQSDHLRLFLDDNAPLPGFPSLNDTTERLHFADRLLKDHVRASYAAAFVQKLREDEAKSPFSPSLEFQFRRLESRLYPFLCFVKLAVTYRSTQQMSDISIDVIKPVTSIETETERHMRDYRILRDIVRLFYLIQSDYNVMYLSDFEVM